ncbi:MAG TPA: T9SS type A sorting domain-containing protein [Calditrichaeota bacterium]|nr:T9SS type A sorting domain-containing protein [Calditrichota bacterium]
MSKKNNLLVMVLLLAGQGFAVDRTEPLLIDHNCENLAQIPLEWIDAAQQNMKWHYAHTSHGGQITTGLQRIEDGDTTYKIARGLSILPTEADALCIFDGQESDTYITPDKYWETKSGMDKTRSVLTNNPNLNVSQWAWCTQLNSYSQAQVQAYLDSISTLETEFPNVTFVYMTGNAQATGSSGYNRYLRNEQIRQYCRDNNKVLYDFADLDAWWYNESTQEWEQNTYEHDGQIIPVEHSAFNGNESGHTTYASCEQKGRAAWWLMANLAGWDNQTSVLEPEITTVPEYQLEHNYPNPFNPETVINYTVGAIHKSSVHVNLSIYNAIGQKIKTLINEKKTAGKYQVIFNGSGLPSGIYLAVLHSGSFRKTIKMMLLR